MNGRGRCAAFDATTAKLFDTGCHSGPPKLAFRNPRERLGAEVITAGTGAQ